MMIKPDLDVRVLSDRFGENSRNRLPESERRDVVGALAALETFYYAFNNRDLGVLRALWFADPLIQLNNPVGGIVRGIEPIGELYARIFDGPGRAHIAFWDVAQYVVGDSVVFAGREKGEYIKDDVNLALNFRTSRIFGYSENAGGWRQMHHHGSIDDPDLLRNYQIAIRGR